MIVESLIQGFFEARLIFKFLDLEKFRSLLPIFSFSFSFFFFLESKEEEGDGERMDSETGSRTSRSNLGGPLIILSERSRRRGGD